jgi:hypothetical protein
MTSLLKVSSSPFPAYPFSLAGFITLLLGAVPANFLCGQFPLFMGEIDTPGHIFNFRTFPNSAEKLKNARSGKKLQRQSHESAIYCPNSPPRTHEKTTYPPRHPPATTHKI